MKYELNQADQDEISENLERLNGILFEYNPQTSKKIFAVIHFILFGIAYVAISLVFNDIIGTIALCVFVLPYLFGSKSKDPFLDANKELALEALLIMQTCVNILRFPADSTLRHVGYTEKYDDAIYRAFIEYFPQYKNTKLNRLVKLCK